MGFMTLITALVLRARSHDSVLSVSMRRVHVVLSMLVNKRLTLRSRRPAATKTRYEQIWRMRNEIYLTH